MSDEKISTLLSDVSIEGDIVEKDKINIKKTANIDGVLNQKTLSIEEGAQLKIKTETY